VNNGVRLNWAIISFTKTKLSHFMLQIINQYCHVGFFLIMGSSIRRMVYRDPTVFISFIPGFSLILPSLFLT